MLIILIILLILFLIIILIEKYFIYEEFQLAFRFNYNKGNFFYKCFYIRNKIKLFFKTFFN